MDKLDQKCNQGNEAWQLHIKGREQGVGFLPNNNGKPSVFILPDANLCDDCLQELMNPANRRHRDPFINCLHCGPRYTIIEALPYNRSNTMMNEFSICNSCKEEFNDPTNSRYQLQIIACPTCGPQLTCWGSEKRVVAKKEAALQATIKALKDGKIVAIKGIGGFHLACDATNEEAVSRLRRKKKRPNKPLAVMAKNITTIEQVAHCDEEEKKVLLSLERPIVLLMKKNGVNKIAPSIQKDYETIGMFLPYTPLHFLLMEHFDFLVMTSANLSGEPVFYEDEEILSRGNDMADLFLGHDRKIARPIDDSVMEIRDRERHFYRRARGFVPEPILAPIHVEGIIALGASIKNTFTFGQEKHLFLSAHNGDLENIYSMNQAHKLLKTFLSLLEIEPKTYVVDKHPNYPQRSWLGETDIPIFSVWHHHAHFVSCIADNGLPLEEDYIGVILDGTGFGIDEKIWGFEWIVGNVYEFKRIAHAQYQPLLGGDEAIRHPWRQAIAWILKALPEAGKEVAYKLFPNNKDEIEWFSRMLERKLNMQEAGTCGRLFDVVSAMTKCCLESTYEGEAAILLSEKARITNEKVEPYPFSFMELAGERTFMTDPLLNEILQDIIQGETVEKIAHRFHETIVVAVVNECIRIAEKTGLKRIVFSGGSMHNAFFEREFAQRLRKVNLDVYFHRNIPCNDGGISYGQAIIAAYDRKMKEG